MISAQAGPTDATCRGRTALRDFPPGPLRLFSGSGQAGPRAVRQVPVLTVSWLMTLQAVGVAPRWLVRHRQFSVAPAFGPVRIIRQTASLRRQGLQRRGGRGLRSAERMVARAAAPAVAVLRKNPETAIPRKVFPPKLIPPKLIPRCLNLVRLWCLLNRCRLQSADLIL